MFRQMRRNSQRLSAEECVDILVRATSGVLALSGDGGYPYAVPLSYVYDDSKLYFHSAVQGHKIDAVRGCDKASFCVIDRDEVVAREYTSYFRSVIAFGRIRILDDADEARKAMEKLAVKYHPRDIPAHRQAHIASAGSGMCMIELAVEHLSGKAAKELVAARPERGI